MNIAFSLLALVLAGTGFQALAQPTPPPYIAFKNLQYFLMGNNNWGKSENGDCRFDFKLVPDINGLTGFTDGEALSATVNLDKPAGDFSLDFKDIIGRNSFELRKIGSNKIELRGGDYDGDAKITLQKLSDGTVVIKAFWEDSELGPNRAGTCVLPKVNLR